MKHILAGLAIVAGSALGLAPKADAAPFTPAGSSLMAGHGTWGVGIGVGGGGYGGGGYGGGYGGYAPAYTGGYYRTEVRWVPVTVLAGYDIYRRPVYTTQYVQQAYQVYVPYAPVYYAPRPAVTWGVGVGYRWR